MSSPAAFREVFITTSFPPLHVSRLGELTLGIRNGDADSCGSGNVGAARNRARARRGRLMGAAVGIEGGDPVENENAE